MNQLWQQIIQKTYLDHDVAQTNFEIGLMSFIYQQGIYLVFYVIWSANYVVKLQKLKSFEWLSHLTAHIAWLHSNNITRNFELLLHSKDRLSYDTVEPHYSGHPKKCPDYQGFNKISYNTLGVMLKLLYGQKCKGWYCWLVQ